MQTRRRSDRRLGAGTLRFLAGSAALLFGVTLLTFVMLVWAGPDPAYALAGKNPTPEQIAEIRHELGHDRPFAVRYADYLRQLATLDLGRSQTSGERVSSMLGRTLPVTAALMLPPFVIGQVLAALLGLTAAWYRGRPPDRLITGASVVGMSISYVVIIIAFQTLLSSSYGLGLFPVRGWSMENLPTYLHYETVPALCILFVTLGYNTRFYRALFAEGINEPHVLTSRSFGVPPRTILRDDVLRPAAGPVLVQVLYSLPLIVIGGSLLIESQFGIPGAGRLTFEAIINGDQPVLKAIVGLSAVAFCLVRLATDWLHGLADPRVLA